MASPEEAVRVYQELAADYDRQGQAQVRDRFLVLAADAALGAGQADEAERFRSRLLQLNPHHMLKPFASFAQAMQSTDIRSYVEGLRRNYPPADAVHLLEMMRTGPDASAPYGIQHAAPAELAVPQPVPSMSVPVVPVSPSPRRMPTERPSDPVPAVPRPETGNGVAEQPTPYALAPEGGPAEPNERESETGGWLVTALFGLLLALGLALLVWTFARPFLAPLP